MGGDQPAQGGAADPDPLYPHPNAKLGSRGLDPLTAQFYEPELYSDFMSYCRPYWISDYRFKKNYGVQSALTSFAGASMVLVDAAATAGIIEP